MLSKSNTSKSRARESEIKEMLSRSSSQEVSVKMNPTEINEDHYIKKFQEKTELKNESTLSK